MTVAAASGALVRRFGEHVAHQYDPEKIISSIPPLTWTAISAVIFLYIIGYFAITYSYGMVVATLAMVETPSATAIVQTSTKDIEEPDAPLLFADEKSDRTEVVQQEVLLVSEPAITAKPQATIKHLRARAGWTSRFRGLQLFIMHSVLHSFIVFILPLSRSLSGLFISQTIASFLLARVSMAWTHHVISEPGTTWRARLRYPRTTVRKVLIPTLAAAAIKNVVDFIPLLMFVMAPDGSRMPAIMILGFADKDNIVGIVVGFAGVFLLYIALYLFLVIPAHIALIRVQASLLPEEEESIVPFDRTFGGKVVPAIVGGSGKISMKDAWKTMDWNARMRVFKVWLQTGLRLVSLSISLAASFFVIFLVSKPEGF